MHAVDSKDGKVSLRPKVVVLLAPIPDDQVVINELKEHRSLLPFRCTNVLT